MLTFSCRPRKGDKRRAPACRAQRGAGRPLKRRGGSGRGDSASLESIGAAKGMNSSPRLMPTAGPAPTPRISIRPHIRPRTRPRPTEGPNPWGGETPKQLESRNATAAMASGPNHS